MTRGVAAALLLHTALACASADKAETKKLTKATISRAPFGVLPSGDSVHVYTLTNTHGLEMRVLDYGGIVVSIKTPDRNGTLADIVLGYDNLDGYLKSSPYFGALVGRYANRIAKGKFTLDDRTYSLAVNNGVNALHGGAKGFDKVLWLAEPRQDSTGVGVVLTYISKDGEEGYPGTLSVRVTYMLTDQNEFAIDYLATTDKATIVNLTHHSYFNLAGDGAGDVLGHVVSINADAFTPVDSTLIPTGVIQSVDDTPFDFRQPVAIGEQIAKVDEQLSRAKGIDHNFLLIFRRSVMTQAAFVSEPLSGRTLEVTTSEPGLQFYTGNFLDGSNIGKSGHVYNHRGGFCLETQHSPDSPNQAEFPTTILRPGDVYRSRTVYTFGVEPVRKN
ncbi:MAG: aldose epimerase family protein [Gemmatimonas sp.]